MEKRDILFRCSRLGDLMTDSKELSNEQKIQKNEELIKSSELRYSELKNKETKTAKNLLLKIEGYKSNIKELEPFKKDLNLSQTTKSYLEALWLENEIGYREDVVTDAMLKGHLLESESRQMITDYFGTEPRLRYNQKLQNEFVIGTPDVVLTNEDYVEDIKNSENIRTFMNAELAKNYYWQGQGYMWLTGKSKYRLIYTLNPTPEELQANKKKSFWYKFGCDETNEDYIRISEQIDKNNRVIESLSLEQRVKVFEFDRNDDDIEQLKERIKHCREYYKTIKI